MNDKNSKQAFRQAASSQRAGTPHGAAIRQMPNDERQTGKEQALKTLSSLLEALEARVRSRNARVPE